jgi:hypothetical protein
MYRACILPFYIALMLCTWPLVRLMETLICQPTEKKNSYKRLNVIMAVFVYHLGTFATAPGRAQSMGRSASTESESSPLLAPVDQVLLVTHQGWMAPLSLVGTQAMHA